jgi:hypothetical protein
MTPVDWAEVQQWDAGRRLLMVLHPGFGLSQAGIVLGTWSPDFRTGWNRTLRDKLAGHPEVFTYFGPDGAETTTDRPPAGPKPVHTTRASPLDLKSSPLWWVARAIGRQVADRKLLPADVVQRAERSIEHFAQDLRHQALMQERTRRAVAAMGKALMESRGGAIKAGDFLAPAFQIVSEYLSFELPGMIASEILAVVLSTQSTVPPLGPPQMMKPRARLRAAEHLANLSYELVAGRAAKSLPAYFEMTYLASLYGRTALLLTNWAGASGRHSPEETERLKRLALNVDELFAHRIAPCFTLPALLTPFEMLAWLEERATADRTADDVAEHWQVHPALRSQLAPGSAAPRTPESVAAAFKSGSDRAEQFDVDQALRANACPVDPSNLEDIHRAILTLTLGSARR